MKVTRARNKALISNWIYFPRDQLTDGEIDHLRRQLTFLPRMGEDNKSPEPILLYRDSAETFAVPVAIPDDVLPSDNVRLLLSEAEYDLAAGETVSFPSRPDPNHPSVKDPAAQAVLMESMLAAARTHIAFIAQAATGTGKTACALNTVAELGVNSLVIVPTEYLATQWEKSIKNLLGATDADIGRLQGDRIDIRGKKIVIAIVNSVAMRDYPDWVYRYFGAVIVDECHRVGSHVFSQALPRFNARYKIGLSATPKRKDGADKVIQYHVGGISAYSEAEALFTRVYAMNYRTRGKLWGRTHGALVKCLTLDAERNKLIVKIIKTLYGNGRQVLVVSDSIPHLQTLMGLCQFNGVPRGVMGQFTGQRYMPDGSKQKVTREELEYIKIHSRIIFATYQMMKEGVDIPRLDAGVDATPRTDAIQLVGRIRRPYPNKLRPVWYTIIDSKSRRLVGYYGKRKQEYIYNNMEVIENG